jgi:hypothetical protein
VLGHFFFWSEGNYLDLEKERHAITRVKWAASIIISLQGRLALEIGIWKMPDGHQSWTYGFLTLGIDTTLREDGFPFESIC